MFIEAFAMKDQQRLEFEPDGLFHFASARNVSRYCFMISRPASICFSTSGS
jgi:hypothetical protein